MDFVLDKNIAIFILNCLYGWIHVEGISREMHLSFHCFTKSQGWDRKIDKYAPASLYSTLFILFVLKKIKSVMPIIVAWIIWSDPLLLHELVIQFVKPYSPRTGIYFQSKWKLKYLDIFLNLHFIFDCWSNLFISPPA